MGRGLDISFEPTPVDVNPYVGPGLAGVPAVLERCADTSADLARVVSHAEFLRGMVDADVASASGVDETDVRRLRDTGRGRVEHVLAVLRALSVKAVTLPPPTDFEGAEEG